MVPPQHAAVVRRLARWAGPLAVLLSVQSAHAQGTSALRGTVTDAKTHAPVANACVAIDQTACSALTSSRGAYLIRGVSAGAHALTVTALGSKPYRADVTVAAGQESAHDVSLEPGPLLLSGMIVSATRLPTEAGKVASTVNVLTPEQVATTPARESQDMLREIPGVELPRTSSLVGGTAQIVSIRGVDEGRTVVLHDGIPISDAWGEWIDWGRVPKGMVDHVEVVEGGTSNLYGNGAIGGVISFFSRPMAPGSARFSVDAGSRDARHAFGAIGLPAFGAFTATLSGDYLEGGGYTMLDSLKRGTIDVPSEITQRNGTLRVNYAPGGKWSGFATGHLFGDTRHLGTPLGLATRNQWNTDLGLTRGTAATGQLALRSWYGHQKEFQRAAGVRGNSATCAVTSTVARQCEDSSSTADIPSTDWGLSAQWTRNQLFGFESFTFGGDYRHMDGEYQEHDFNTSCPGANCGKSLRDITSGGDQTLSGVFVQAILAPVDPLRVEIGVRFDRWDNNNGHSLDPIAGDTTYTDRSKNAFGPRLGARYAVTSNFSVHGAAYHAFRAPNLAELYRKQINANASQITLPNPDLKAESGTGYEGGIDWQPIAWMQVKGTYYVADYKDFNVPTTLSAGPPAIRQRLNINKSRSTGGGVYVSVRPIPSLVFTGSANRDDAKIVSSDSTNGLRINRVPSPKYTVRGSWTSAHLGTFTGIYRYEGNTTTLQGLTLAPFSVYDANWQRELVSGLSAFVSAENIGDTRYQVNISGTGANALISYGLPRTLRGGLSWVR